MASDEQEKLDRLKMPDIGDLLDGRYRIQAVLATGGMGVVLRAEQLPMERPVAIKLLHPHIAAANAKVLTRFEQEVRLAKLLNHPNTIRLYDFGESSEGLVYVAMEYLDGRDLKRVIDEDGCLPVGRAVEIARQMLDGLAEAHSHDFIHRDLKPSNVFVTKNRRGQDFVKLLDFGIAKSLDDGDLDLTASGSICGTPGYVAPEYLRSESLDKASDVYAVGLMLLEMLIGQRVFKGDGAVQTMMMHLQIDPDIPPAIENTALAPIIRKATCKQPEGRYADADEMLRAIEAVIDELPHDLRIEDYQSPDSPRVSAQPLTPPPKVKQRFDEASSPILLDEDSSASLPGPDATPLSMANHQSGPHSLGPPPLPNDSPTPEPQLNAPAGEVKPARTEVVGGDTGELAFEFAGLSSGDPKQLWMLGGGVLGVLTVILLAFILLDPGDASEIETSAGSETVSEAGGGEAASEGPARALAAIADAGDDSSQVQQIRFDLDTDPSGATARVGERILGATPVIYHVAPENLPQTVIFEHEGYAEASTVLTEESLPIVVEVLEDEVPPDEVSKGKVSKDEALEVPQKSARGARVAEHSRKQRGGARKNQGSKSRRETKKKLSDDKVEKVLDEFLLE